MRRLSLPVLALLLLLSSDAEALPPATAGWRSSLYPTDWGPGYTDAEGRFLHDFSYAGYRNGKVPIPARSDAKIYNVAADFGADKAGATDATKAI